LVVGLSISLYATEKHASYKLLIINAKHPPSLLIIHYLGNNFAQKRD
jgi:hypothetical protein